MKLLPIILILFWIVIIAMPEIVAYLIGWLLIFIGVNMLLMWFAFKQKMGNKDSYVKFGNYKIFR